MNNPKISVIIPVYNSEQFLVQSIESVLNQTYENIEIIVVNDGSTDNSLKILKQYSDRIKIISQYNMGLFHALESGIKHSTGSWMKWFSPDDIMYSNALEILIQKAISYPESIVFSDWNIIDKHDKVLRRFHENDDELTTFAFGVRLLDNQQINVNTSLIPIKLVKDQCKFQNLANPVAIDYDFFLRASLVHNIHFIHISKLLIGYRIHQAQLSHQNITQTLSYLEEIKQQILEKLDLDMRNKYLKALNMFQQSKPLYKKTMEAGFQVMSFFLPTSITDRLIMIYLNNIRRRR